MLGLMVGFVGVLVGALIVGLAPEPLETRVIPNQGTRSSILNAIIFGLIGGLVGWLVFGLIPTLVSEPDNALAFGLVTGLALTLRFGGYALLIHYTLHLSLFRDNFMPLEYVRFLDYAPERIFLRKVGGYIFVHRMPMERFAA